MNVTHNGNSKHYRTLWFDKAQNRVKLIEQRLLPHQFKIVSTTDYFETARTITDMVVR
ncbi:MAG TPA: S-methyl-5-thioribose-1-phosphate isomerase, partial [Verrucomicrobiales bacterium]|nr:S-methyl-5-thioribose-1-phosphate isomerase [Verrucomicrobiales bacterium]